MIDINDKIRKEIKDIPTEEYATANEVDNNPIVLDMSLNINPYGVSKRVLAKLSELGESSLYNYYLENKSLVEEIGKQFSVKNENIIIADGCDGCIEIISKVFIEEQDEVLIPVPTFHRYEFHSRVMGAKPIFVNMENFEFDAGKVLEKVSKNTKIIFLCNPNNPTGLEIKASEKKKILDNFDGIVVVDEALADITDINGSSLINDYNNLIVLRSFSKSYGLASLRIGYAIASEEIIKQLKKVSSPFKVNGLAQELALEAIKDKEYIAKSNQLLNAEREFLIKNLRNLGFECTSSKTTNLLLSLEPINSDLNLAIDKLRKKGVLVTNGSFFKIPNNKYVRIAVNTREKNEKFIEIIKTLIEV